MQARVKHPAIAIPDAMQALQALAASSRKSGVPERTLELVNLRASQINGCSACVDMHPRLTKRAGETDERLFAVAAWREAPYFTDAERAALARTPCRTRSGTRLSETMMQRRLRVWSSPSPTSMYGTASISPCGSRPVHGNHSVLRGRTEEGPLPGRARTTSTKSLAKEWSTPKPRPPAPVATTSPRRTAPSTRPWRLTAP
jgi:AhpD family alkylhydroperoxidase